MVDLRPIETFIERQAKDGYADAFHAAIVRFRNRLGLGRRESSTIGFTTAFRIRFQSAPAVEKAEAVVRGIQALLDEEREQIDPVLDGITVRRTPSVKINDIDGTLVLMPIELSTKRDLAPVDRFALAIALVDYLRQRLEVFPELVEVPEDGTPPVATTGF